MRHTDAMSVADMEWGRTGLGAWLLGLLCVLATGCANAPAAKPTPPAAPTDASVYYPLESGWGWAYDVTQDGVDILATYSVDDRVNGIAVVKAGSDRLTYAVRADGVARQRPGVTDDYVIKSPVVEGTSWSLSDGQARIVWTGRSVTVPAGSYDNCARVEESHDNGGRIVRTTFAPHVGPVLVEVEERDAATGATAVTMKAALRGVSRPDADPMAASRGPGLRLAGGSALVAP